MSPFSAVGTIGNDCDGALRVCILVIMANLGNNCYSPIIYSHSSLWNDLVVQAIFLYTDNISVTFQNLWSLFPPNPFAQGLSILSDAISTPEDNGLSWSKWGDCVDYMKLTVITILHCQGNVAQKERLPNFVGDNSLVDVEDAGNMHAAWSTRSVGGSLIDFNPDFVGLVPVRNIRP
ncbi:unnamed protein product [Vicia faba]|uniref:Uncharacterized protein n=1 Tax=Vicia faba TaxID=3906 RepID=A0AAV0ZW69_VICFA|nr:unnamed protein product [Vicia faba]